MKTRLTAEQSTTLAKYIKANYANANDKRLSEADFAGVAGAALGHTISAAQVKYAREALGIENNCTVWRRENVAARMRVRAERAAARAEKVQAGPTPQLRMQSLECAVAEQAKELKALRAAFDTLVEQLAHNPAQAFLPLTAPNGRINGVGVSSELR